MLRTFKFISNPERRIYFSSDWHLGHDKPFIWEKRGYADNAAHTQGILEKVNEIVREQDYLFYLGDLCLNTKEIGFEYYISKINCKNIWILWGNHYNPLWRIYLKEMEKIPALVELAKSQGLPTSEIYPFRYKNLIFCGDYLEIFVDGHSYVLCHYPMTSFNQMKYNGYMLCGHSHYGYELTQAENKAGKYLDVGWDGHQKPISTEEVKAIMDTKLTVTVDHH